MSCEEYYTDEFLETKEEEERIYQKKQAAFKEYLNQKLGHRIFLIIRRSIIFLFFLSFMACFYVIYPNLFKDFDIMEHLYDLALLSIFFVILDAAFCYAIYCLTETTIGIRVEDFYRKDYIEPKDL